MVRRILKYSLQWKYVLEIRRMRKERMSKNLKEQNHKDYRYNLMINFSPVQLKITKTKKKIKSQNHSASL